MRKDPTNATPHRAKRKRQAHKPQEQEKRHCIKAKETAWLDYGAGHQVIRVLHEPGETTLLYCLAPHNACLYEASSAPAPRTP